MADRDAVDTLVGLPRRRSWRLPARAAAGLAIVLASAAAVYTLVPRPYTSPFPPLPALVTAPPRPSPPPPAVVTVQAPMLRLLENPADPIQLAGYRIRNDTYVRGPAGFTKMAASEVARSPDGTWFALVMGDSVRFVDRDLTVRFTVPVGAGAEGPRWSGDGNRLLLTTGRGFAVIDLSSQKATVVPTDGDRGRYSWLPDGSGVAVGAARGIRFRDLRGRQTLVMAWVGRLYGGALFSPSGKRFVTHCPSNGLMCVWDTRTGMRHQSIGNSGYGWIPLGWYDDDYLIVRTDDRGPNTAVIKAIEPSWGDRVLAESESESQMQSPVQFFYSARQ